MTGRMAKPQLIARTELGAVIPHVRVAIRALRARSRWALDRGLWTDAQLTAESADGLAALARRIDSSEAES